MHAHSPTAVESLASHVARQRLLSRRWEPLFYADWERAVFLHYEVSADALQREVPFPLDLWEGRAYVSLVAFTMRGMRFRFGGRLGAWLCRPIATHDFLNARTYVRQGDESGIFFLREWLSSRLCVSLGPLTFGLPYRFGRTTYQHRHEAGTLIGSVSAPRSMGQLRYQSALQPGTKFEVCPAHSLDEFLIERYIAFTSNQSTRRFFRVWHEPWLQTRIEVKVLDDELIARTWPWFAGARWAGANYSPGLRDIWIGWPHRV